MNWNWKTVSNNKQKINGCRVRITITDKAKNHSITFDRNIYDALGRPEHVCFCVNSNGVFVTSEKVGTLWRVIQKGESHNPIIASKDVSEAIFRHFGMDVNKSDYINLDYVAVDDNVFKLTKKFLNKYGSFL
jgi:hypothetical protein